MITILPPPDWMTWTPFMVVFRSWRGLPMLLAGILLASCQSFGPSRGSIERAASVPSASGAATAIRVVQVKGDTAYQLPPIPATPAFAGVLGGVRPVGTAVETGDAVEVTIWEAPPATLFGGPTADTRIGTPISTSRPTVLPELLVGPEGTISVPFAGAVPARGRTLREIEEEIVRRLRGRANAPQAQVRLSRNVTSTVTTSSLARTTLFSPRSMIAESGMR